MHSFILSLHYTAPLQATFLSAIHLFWEIYTQINKRRVQDFVPEKKVFHSNEQKASCIIIF